MDSEPVDPLPPPSQAPTSDASETPALVAVGSAVFGGVVAALAAALPAALRLGGAGSIPRAWVGLAAVATPLAVVAVGALRRARVGARMVAGERLAAYGAGLLLWSSALLLVLSAFGSLLRKNTHHHGLAGVTFGIFAVVSGLGLALAVARLVRSIATTPSAQRGLLSVSALAAFAVVTYAGVRASHAEGLHVAASLIDTLALAIACGIASSKALTRRRAFAFAGVPLAALVVVIGLSALRGDAQLREALGTDAPIFAMSAAAFGR